MEKIIGDLAEVARVEVSAVDGRAEVTLTHPVTLPTERILTSGWPAGITFRIDHRLFPRLRSSCASGRRPRRAHEGPVRRRAVHYQRSRGIHGAALADGERLLVVAEDVGRHNAVDKVKGEALLRGIATEDRMLISTGRISSEMLLKAARMGCRSWRRGRHPRRWPWRWPSSSASRCAATCGPDALNVYAGDAVLARAPVGTAGG